MSTRLHNNFGARISTRSEKTEKNNRIYFVLAVTPATNTRSLTTTFNFLPLREKKTRKEFVFVAEGEGKNCTRNYYLLFF